MPTFFPRKTIELRLEEPKAFRKFSFSIVEMAIVTGVLLRVYRVVVLTQPMNNLLLFGTATAFGVRVYSGQEPGYEWVGTFKFRDYGGRRGARKAAEQAEAEARFRGNAKHRRNGKVASRMERERSRLTAVYWPIRRTRSARDSKTPREPIRKN